MVMSTDAAVTVEVEPSSNGGDAPEVIVVDTGDADSGASSTELDHESRITRLEGRVDELESRVSETHLTAELAQIDAGAAVEIAADAAEEVRETVEEVLPAAEAVAEEVAEEVAEDATEQDTEPDREHWFFKRRSLR